MNKGLVHNESKKIRDKLRPYIDFLAIETVTLNESNLTKEDIDEYNKNVDDFLKTAKKLLDV